MNIRYLIFCCWPVISLSSQSALGEWLANTGLGISYSDNYALQNGDYTNIDQAMIDRTGAELTGGVSWQSLDESGGFNVDATALVDKAFDRNSKITQFSVAGSRIQPLSRDWLSRFTASLLQYGNDDFTANAYDGFSLAATIGWFGESRRGLDMSLSWINEDHNQNLDALYTTQRLGMNTVYYFASTGSLRNSVSFGIQQNNADDDRRDSRSLLVGASMNQIRWQKNELRLSINWRQDKYDLAYTPLPGDQSGLTYPGGVSGSGMVSILAHGGGHGGGGHGGGTGSGSGNGPGNGAGSGGVASSAPRTDTQIYLNANYQYPIAKNLRLFVNASTGRYSSVTGKQSFYTVLSGARWYFN